MSVYGSTAGVTDLLESQGTNDWSESELARIQSLLATVSALIEHDTGATFGEAESETIAVESLCWDKPLLYLPKGLRSVASVTESPEWVSGAWSGGTVLTNSQYRLSSHTVDGYWRTLYRVDGWWGGTYLVTGAWEGTTDDIPEEINYLANYLSAEIFKKQKASPAGFVGQDGVTVAVRNTFSEPEVKRILDMHRVNGSVVFF